MRGGTTTVQGIYYQVTISVKWILSMLKDWEVDHIVVEAVKDEEYEEDVNILYRNGNIIYEQIKTKKHGFWNFNEFFKEVFENFMSILNRSEKPDSIFFRFVTNAPPGAKLAKLIYDIQGDITEENFYDLLDRIPRFSDRNRNVLRKWSTADIAKIFSRFEAKFTYFASEDPNRPEKYLSEYIKQKLCIECGKTVVQAEEIFVHLHNFVFEKSRHPNREQRIIRRQEITSILGACIPREQRWKEKLNGIFPEAYSRIIFNEIIFGRLYYPKFNINYKLGNEDFRIHLKVYSKDKIWLFKVMPETWSIQAKTKIRNLNRQINQQEDIKMICVTENLTLQYPNNLPVFSTDQASLENFKVLLRG